MKKVIKRVESIVLSCAMATTMMPNLPNSVNTVHAESGIETGEETVEVKDYSIALTAGANMSCTSDGSTLNQTIASGKTINQIVFTASEGYYFTKKYIDDLNKIEAFSAAGLVASASTERTKLHIDSKSDGGIAGGYSATVPDAVEVAVPTGLGDGHTSITGTTKKMEYAPKASSGDTADLDRTNICGEGSTPVEPGTYFVRYAAVADNEQTDDDETKPASEWVKVVVTEEVASTTYSVSITGDSTIVAGDEYVNASAGADANVDITFTAEDGYGFTDDNIATINTTLTDTGLIATRTDGLNKKIKISGTNVTKAVSLVVEASPKGTQGEPSVSGGTETITGFLSSTMEFATTTEDKEESPAEGATWDSTMGALDAGNYWVRLKETDKLAAGTPVKVTVTAAVTPKNVSFSAGTGATTTEEADLSQSGSGVISDVVFTAKDDYYFPAGYETTNKAELKGLTATVSNEGKTLTISGTPTADVTSFVVQATEKAGQEATPTNLDGGINTIKNISTSMQYVKVSEYNAGVNTPWTTYVEGTLLDADTYYVRAKETEDNKASEKTASITVRNLQASDFTLDSLGAASAYVYSSGNAKKPGVTKAGSISIDIGKITVKYYNTKAPSVEVTDPIDAGTYNVEIDVDESVNNKSVTAIAMGNFEITKAKAGAPSVTAVAGGISKTTTAMEYRNKEDDDIPGNWHTCKNSTTPVPEGSYYVRVASEGDNYDPGTPTDEIIVSASDVKIAAGSNMILDSVSGTDNQTNVSGTITDIKFKANKGYCFDTSYVNTLNATLISYGLSAEISPEGIYHYVTISGNPTKNVDITLSAAVAKAEAEGSVSSVTGGRLVLNNTSASMEYSTDGETWYSCSADKTNVAAGTYQVRIAETVDKAAGTAIRVEVTEGNSNVTLAADSDSILSTSGNLIQNEVATVTDVTFTAKDDYYFKTSYPTDNATGLDGLSAVVGNNGRTVTISGTPDVSTVNFTVTATEKAACAEVAAPFVTGKRGMISKTADTMEYCKEKTDAEKPDGVWHLCDPTNTELAAGVYYVRYAATDTNKAGTSTTRVEVTEKYTITVTITDTSASCPGGNLIQEIKGDTTFNEISITAEGGKCFTPSAIAALNADGGALYGTGLSVTTTDNQTITITGTPKKSVSLSIAATDKKTIEAADFKISTTGTPVYSGVGQKPTVGKATRVDGTLGEITLYFCEQGEDSSEATEDLPVDANEYVVYATAAGSGTYEAAVDKIRIGTFTIAKKTLTLSVDPVTYTVGDEITPLTVNVTGFISGEEGHLSGYAAPTVNFSPELSTASAMSITSKNITIASAGTPTKNYEFGALPESINVTINQADITAADFVAVDETNPYTGVAQGVTVSTVDDKNLGVVKTYYCTENADSATAEEDEPTNVGKYDVYVTAAGNDNYKALATKTMVGTFEITAVELTLSVDDLVLTVGDSVPETLTVNVSAADFVNGETTEGLSALGFVAPTAEFAESVTTGTSMASTPKTIRIKNAGTPTGNYTFSSLPASINVTVKKAVQASDFTLSDTTYEYSREVKNPTVTDKTVGIGEVTNLKYYDQLGSQEVTPKDVGTYVVKADVADSLTYKGGTQVKVGTFTITAKPVTINQVEIKDKTYDGTTAAELKEQNYELTGVKDGDTVEVTQGTVTFDSANYSEAATATAVGFDITGTDSSNYALSGQPSVKTAKINKAELTITGVKALAKTYDGTTAAEFDNQAGIKLSGLAGADQGDTNKIALVNGEIEFTSKDAAGTVAARVKESNQFSITGTSIGNYTLTQPTVTGAKISQKTLTLTVDPITIKRNAIVPTSITVKVAGFENGETADSIADFEAPTAQFNEVFATSADFDAQAKAIKSKAAGNATSNYKFGALPETVNVTVTGKEVLSQDNFVLETLDSYEYSKAAIKPEVMPANSITTGDITVFYYDYNGSPVTDPTAVGTYTVKIDVAGNENFVAATKLEIGTFTITKATLEASDFNYTDEQPVYNGTEKSASVTKNGLTTDTAIIVSYTDSDGNTVEHPTNAKTYNVLISRAEDACYDAVTDLKVGELTIKQATITLSGSVVANDKTYDRLTTATIKSNTLAIASGRAAADREEDVYLNDGTLEFTSANAGASVAVRVNGFDLGGPKAANYKLSAAVTAANAKIDQKKIDLTGTVTAKSKTYNGETAAEIDSDTLGLDTSDICNGDVVTLDKSEAALAFVSENVGPTVNVEAKGYKLGGAAMANYKIDQPTVAAAEISQKKITFTGEVTATPKTYDGTTAATIALDTLGLTASDICQGDVVTLDKGGATLTFVSKNAGESVNVTAANYALSGAARANYKIDQPTVDPVKISQKKITFTGSVTATPKTYDGTTAATIASDTLGLNSSDICHGDEVTLVKTGATLTFASENAGESVNVAATSYALGGAARANYMIDQPTVKAVKIDQKTLTLAVDDVTYKVGDLVPASLPVNVTGFENGEEGHLTGYAAPTAKFTTPGVTTGTPFAQTPKAIEINAAGTPTANYKFGALPSTINVTVKAEFNVTLNADATMTTSGDTEQTELTGAMTTVTFTAADGYYFPATYASQSVTGVTVERVNNTTIRVSGTPTADTEINIVAATAKATPGAPEGLTGGINTITGIETTMEYISTSAFTGGITDIWTPYVANTLLDADSYYVRIAKTETANAGAKTAAITVKNLAAANFNYDDPSDLVYDADAKEAEVTAKGITTGTITVKYYKAGSVPVNEAIDVGEYTVKIDVAASETNKAVEGIEVGSFTVTRKDVTISGVKALDKTYDGTDTAAIDTGSEIEIEGFITGTVVSVANGTLEFASKNAGDSVAVTASGFALTGADSENYNLTAQPTVANARINKAALTVKVNDVVINAGEKMPKLTVLVTGFVNGEDSETVADFTAPTATVKGTVNTENTSLTQFDVEVTGGNATANYEFGAFPTTAKIKINAKKEQAAPMGLGDGHNKITGTTAAMEYATSEASTSWKQCKAGATEVEPGTYYVRYAETATMLAGKTAKVVVTPFKKPAGFTLEASGIYVMGNANNVITAGLVTNKADADVDIEYYWTATQDNGKTWTEVSDWTLNNEWINWKPENYGDYVLVCKARIAGDAKSEVSSTVAVVSHPILKGVCQMPNADGTFLIGMETYDNYDYSYEMQVLDCSLLAAGSSTPWVYTTGMLKTDGNAVWTT